MIRSGKTIIIFSMKILPKTLDSALIEIHRNWADWQDVIFSETNEEVLVFPVKYIKVLGESDESSRVKELLPQEALKHYINSLGLEPTHPISKAYTILEKSISINPFNEAEGSKSFMPPNITDIEAPLEITFENQFEYMPYEMEIDNFKEYLNSFKSFIEFSDNFSKALDTLYEYNEKMEIKGGEEIDYFISKDGYLIDFNYIANALMPTSQFLGEIEYWREWVEDKNHKNHLKFERNPYQSFEKITDFSTWFNKKDFFLVLGYCTQDEQFNIYFMKNDDINLKKKTAYRTFDISEIEQLLFDKTNAMLEANSIAESIAEGVLNSNEDFIFVGEYKEGILGKLHFLPGCSADYSQKTKSALEKFKINNSLMLGPNNNINTNIKHLLKHKV